MISAYPNSGCTKCNGFGCRWCRPFTYDCQWCNRHKPFGLAGITDPLNAYFWHEMHCPKADVVPRSGAPEVM